MNNEVWEQLKFDVWEEPKIKNTVIKWADKWEDKEQVLKDTFLLGFQKAQEQLIELYECIEDNCNAYRKEGFDICVNKMNEASDEQRNIKKEGNLVSLNFKKYESEVIE